jgi:hypothetical protein
LLSRHLPSLIALAMIVGPGTIAAAAAPFDLEGPGLEVRVTRAGDSLPVAEVPNLLSGDSVSIKVDFPESQSAKYLLVVAFLRGATNPPPANWFIQCETWKKKCREEGIEVTVPEGAEQALAFLAPSSGNGFRTLVGAVQGRPGAFVRAAQQLNQASLDRARLEIYLQELRKLDTLSQERVKEAIPLLARSLAIKVNEKCLDRIPQLQVSCLMDGQDTLILSDGHSASMIEALTGSPASEALMTAARTPQLNSGYYSPYISSVIDLARLLDPFKRANYNYVPTLAFQRDERMALRLNTPPSFQNPKSVLVAALPAIETPRQPLMRAVDPRDIFCARKSSLVLPVEGAPLVFGTQYAHDLQLQLTLDDGSQIELPARPEALQGGFVVDTAALASAQVGPRVRGVLKGKWGFEEYVGPEFQMVMPVQQSWRTGGAEDDTLIVGRDGVVRVRAESVSCLKDVEVEGPDGRRLTAQWQLVAPGEVEVKFPLQQVQPGELTLRMNQYGAETAQPVALKTYSAAAQLDAFVLHEGDTEGQLKGQRLDQVSGLSVSDISFEPRTFTRGKGADELEMLAQEGASKLAQLNAGEPLSVRVTLRDGRTLALRTNVLPARPGARLIDKNVQLPRTAGSAMIRIDGDSELPLGGTLTFSLRSRSPNGFGANDRVEIASLDGSFSTTLTLAQNQLKRVSATVIIASLDPVKEFGPAAFGPLQFRVASGEFTGNWASLVTLIRVPELSVLKCAEALNSACSLSGTDLYLVEAVARGPTFEDAVQVPEGFPGDSLLVPHPGEEGLYLKLRDNPAVIHAVSLPVSVVEAEVEAEPPAG